MKHIKVIGVVLLLTFLVSLYSCKKNLTGELTPNSPPTVELTNVTSISDSTYLAVIDSIMNLICPDTSCLDSLLSAFFGAPRLIWWKGTDLDGIVDGFWYTFNDTTNSFAAKYKITIIDGDTIFEPIPVDENLWNWTEEDSLPIKLPSMDSLNQVSFYVIAEDDEGALSLEGDTLRIASTVFLRRNNEN
jgi:hypothetical protein